MTNPNDPANPTGMWGQQTTSGMTKRELFAYGAMIAITGVCKNNSTTSYDSIAEESCRLADAMIKALNRQ